MKAGIFFDQAPPRNVCSWNALILRNAKQGQFQDALVMYEDMHKASLQPNEYAIAALLRACSEVMDCQTGLKIHAHAVERGLLESDLFLGNTVIDMYVKFGSLIEARAVFEALPVHDVVSWNVLLSGFIKHSCCKEVFRLYKLMQVEEVSPNAVTFVSSLKACGLAGAIDIGQDIHAEVARQGLLERDLIVGNALVDMYTKCRSLALAKEVFDKLVERDSISWNALMVGYAKFDYAKETLHSFEQMQMEGIFPDAVTLVCGLKASGVSGARFEGEKIHAWISCKGLQQRDPVVANALLDMYATCGDFMHAKQLFDKLLVRDVVSWTSLIAGYSKHNCSADAFFCFDQMQHEGTCPNAKAFVCALKACGSNEALHKGKEIHVKIEVLGLAEENSYICNSLVDMYAKCGRLGKAQEVFDRLPCKDTASWNALIAGYAQNEQGQEALACLERMDLAGVPLDAVTLVCGLKACSIIGDAKEGEHLENEVFRKDFLHDVIVANALISFYTSCGLYFKAHELFDRLPKQDVASWTTIMASYMKWNQGEDALHCFEQMQAKGIRPDALTFVCSLRSCGVLGVLDKGKEIHAEIEKMGLLEGNQFVCSALLDMYFKCGWAAGAQKLFDRLPAPDIVMWTALLAGYAYYEEHQIEAFMSFEQLDVKGASLDVVAYTRGLEACGTVGAIGKGIGIHVEIAGRGMLESGQPVLGNALVSMYAKWGLLTYAQEVFDKMPVRDVNSFNALMSGYAQQGDVDNVFRILKKMTAEIEGPNFASFTSVLNACGHAGLVDKGKTLFDRISKEHGVIPSLKHHMCMIDLFNRAGYLDISAAMITNMPSHANIAVWQSVLTACEKLGHVDIGKMAFGQSVKNRKSELRS